MDRVTTAPAATIDHEPSSIPQTRVAFAPIDALRRTRVGVTTQSGATARGVRSLVNTAPGPTKTSSASSTPRYTDTLFWIFDRAPIRAPAST